MPYRPAPVALLALLLAGCAAPAETETQRGSSPAPAELTGLVAVGDSFTVGFNPDARHLGEAREFSWATGTSLTSFEKRLGTGWPRVENAAVPGTRLGDFPNQSAASRPSDLLVVAFGTGDACFPPPTPPGDFAATARRVLGQVERPDRLFVMSVFDVPQIQRLFRANPAALAAWEAFDYCHEILAAATTEAALDAARERIQAFNAALDQACVEVGCRRDGGAFFDFQWTVADVSDLDYFHPSPGGAERLAAAAWDGYQRALDARS